jgi:eukaryotic-like serine/threonine-protein kinase
MNVDPEWNLETAFREISARHYPGSFFHGRTRNLMLQVWGEQVGRNRALAELEALVRKCGSKTAFRREFQISARPHAELEAYFEALPTEERTGRWSAGDELGPWTLLRRLGQGGNSEVWRASSKEFGEAALKLPGTGKLKRKRFVAELDLMRRLHDTVGVMPIVSTSDDTAPSPWLAMPIGQEIRHVVIRKDNPGWTLRGVASLAKALATLHDGAISHRDIKPDNIFLLNNAWVLADFGIASFPGKPALTQAGRKLGPAFFIAPEMLNSPESADGCAADVYSLAKTLWVLLSGQMFPPPGEQRASVQGLRISSYVALPRATELDALMEDCTLHEPARRPTARQVATRLTSIGRSFRRSR